MKNSAIGHQSSIISHNTFGFTLVELMIVITLIGLISTIAFGSYQKVQKRSRDSRRKADLTQIQKAMEECYSLMGEYPVITLGSNTEITCGSETPMSRIPSDPGGGNCAYRGSSTTESYLFWADLETAVNGCNGSRNNDDFSVSNLQ